MSEKLEMTKGVYDYTDNGSLDFIPCYCETMRRDNCTCTTEIPKVMADRLIAARHELGLIEHSIRVYFRENRA